MVKYFLLLPTQLFEIKYLSKEYSYILWEHPQYFTKYKFNKKKLLLHRLSMKSYEEYLKKKGFNVKYYEFKEMPKEKDLRMFETGDKLKIKTEIIDTPYFLLTKKDCEDYRKKTKKFFFNAFYMWSKNRNNILPNIKSKDKENRKIPKNKIITTKPTNKYNKKMLNEAISYINTNFKDNYGNTDNFFYPINHLQAKKWLKNFVKNKFKDFGPYQDFISKDNPFLNHSLLSSSINIGLLTPKDVIDEVLKYKNKVPLNSLEGFIRQLYWREYQRYTYLYFDEFNKNYFGNNKKLTTEWYTGETGIKPIDDAIKEAFDLAYLHHIKRLMVIGNFMNLSGISPKEGFKWFMEFSIDSYEWVMYQNVYEMVFFVSGGGTMRRPYVSSSNYILKMSNYKKDDWTKEWDKLYNNFLKTKKSKLMKFRYYFRGLNV